ncbi:MAG: sigma-70 family RNA polymerase sigma factor, partial [Deferribacteraceae bacterium]|nr:sigma-70 family RNA polymerase sigma factor [Deferribacteraceae bacterium]
HANGQEPTTAELATHLSLKEEDVADIIRVSKQSLSLESPVKDGESKAFVDFLEATTEGAEEMLLKEDLKQLLAEMINELDPREIQIIKLRFGFDDEEAYTLEELGKLLGVSRERVRQLESRALSKLRKKAANKSLQDYLAS